MSLQEFGYQEQLSRALTTKDLIIYGMIFMVPIAPYSVFGFVWNDSKGMVPLVYLVGLIGMFFTALSYAAMSRAFPLAGSVYTYAHRGLHEIAGFFSGWLILLDYILVPSLLYLFSAVALRPIFPAVPARIWFGQIWRVDRLCAVAPIGGQPFFRSPAQRRLAAAYDLSGDGIIDHRLRAV